MQSANHVSSATLMDSHPLGRDFLVERYRFKNGLKLIVLEDHSAPLFAYHTWFNVGSRNEKMGTTGIAHLFEHLMFKATKNYPDGHFDNTMETEGGKINAGTSRDWTYYHVNIPKGNLDLVARLEADRMINIALTEEQIKTEQGVVKNERLFRTDNDIDGFMYEKIYNLAFTVHPYHWAVIGFMDDIGAITREDCVNFYKTYYAPNNATIVVVGDVKTAEVIKTIEKYYGDIPSSDVPKLVPPVEPPLKKEIRKVVSRKEHRQPIPADKTFISFRTPAVNHADIPSLEVLNGLLTNGKSSRLYKRLVDETRIASAVSGQVDTHVDPGLFTFFVSMNEGHKAEEAEKIIYEELAKLQSQPIVDRELEKTKNLVESFFVRILKTSQYKAFMMGYFETVVGDYREIFKEVEKYRAVTESDVKRVLKTYLQPNNRVVLIARS